VGLRTAVKARGSGLDLKRLNVYILSIKISKNKNKKVSFSKVKVLSLTFMVFRQIRFRTKVMSITPVKSLLVLDHLSQVFVL
jgi:hypothetical protein